MITVHVQTQNLGDFSFDAPWYDTDSYLSIEDAISDQLTAQVQGASYTLVKHDGTGWQYTVVGAHGNIIKRGQLWWRTSHQDAA